MGLLKKGRIHCIGHFKKGGVIERDSSKGYFRMAVRSGLMDKRRMLG